VEEGLQSGMGGGVRIHLDRLLELRVCVPCAAPQLEATTLSIVLAGPVFARLPQPQDSRLGWTAQPQPGLLAPAALKRRCL
jgi:hypothetical protein